MMNFKNFRELICINLLQMQEEKLFVVDLDKDEIWDLYLNSFPEGSNPLFRERTEHDCSSCRNFIKNAGGIVSVDSDYNLKTIWDVDSTLANSLDKPYLVVANALSNYIKSKSINNIFLHKTNLIGTKSNKELIGDDVIEWDHFYFKFTKKHVSVDKDTVLSKARATKEVFQRGLEEISSEAIDIIIELIDQKSLYRGDQYKTNLFNFQQQKNLYKTLSNSTQDQLNNFYWKNTFQLNNATARIRNSAIGTLLLDLSQGVELDNAVTKFESLVAPYNYKRPTALITKSMIANAQKKVNELGLQDALHRRCAIPRDIDINNVLFASRSIRENKDVFQELAEETPDKSPSLDKVEKVQVNDFLNNILPHANSIELFLENRHQNNLMTLVAPAVIESPLIFQWDNNFSWAYNGEVADSLKERVKKAGGNVNGVLRFSIQWNDSLKDTSIDFDAHCIEPNKVHIYYVNKGVIHSSSGMLDVDIINPGKKVAVENIIYTNIKKMSEGVYCFEVNNYSTVKSKEGFTAEIEFNNQIHTFVYNKPLRGKETVKVAEVNLKKSEFSISNSLPSTTASREIYGLPTHKFHKVSMIMNSPNFWKSPSIGNQHLFFILENCKTEEPVRGFFNEFLRQDLSEHRKVFELLGSKMKAEPVDDQLSGLGFSTTQRNSVVCRVKGSFNRTVVIEF